MRLAIDIRAALVSQPTGKAQWVRGFLSALTKNGVPYIALADRPVPAGLFPTAEIWSVPGHGLGWHFSAARALRRSVEPVLSFNPTSFIVPFLLGKTCSTIPLVHDLIAFDRSPHEFKARLIERLTLPRALLRSAGVCTVSEATKQALLSRFPGLAPEKIAVISAGPFAASPAANSSDGRTILSIGTLCPRKNQLRLIRAFSRLPEALRSQYRLVLAGGRGWKDDEVVRLAETTPGVQWLGYVSDAAYENLLRSCAVFAFPSLDEGFGIPVLDALQRGIPVLTSDRGSLPEVAGNAAVYIDPEDDASIAAGLERILTDPALQSRLRAGGPLRARSFSWERSVDLFLHAVKNWGFTL